MDDQSMDRAARMALEANIQKSRWVRFKSFVNRWPDTISFIFAIAALGVLIALTAWEAHNSASGWVMIAKGAAPSFMAYATGAAIVIGYVAFHRRTAEHLRAAKALKKQPGKGELQKATRMRAHRTILFSLFAMVLALFGVFSNLASKTAASANGAQEANEARSALLIEQRDLQRDLRYTDIAQLTAMIEADTSTLKSMIAEAKGWDMPDLDPDGACAGDLRPRQRQLCNRANGTAEEGGVRGDILISQAALETAEAKAKRLEEVSKTLEETKRAEGSDHWKAMGDMAGGQVDQDFFRIWGMFLASVFVLIIIGVGWDELFERLEDQEEAGDG